MICTDAYTWYIVHNIFGTMFARYIFAPNRRMGGRCLYIFIFHYVRYVYLSLYRNELPKGVWRRFSLFKSSRAAWAENAGAVHSAGGRWRGECGVAIAAAEQGEIKAARSTEEGGRVALSSSDDSRNRSTRHSYVCARRRPVDARGNAATRERNGKMTARRRVIWQVKRKRACGWEQCLLVRIPRCSTLVDFEGI